MQLNNFRSTLIIGMKTFAFLRGTISSYPIYHLLCNQCKVHSNDEYTDKSYRPQFIWPEIFMGVIYAVKTSKINILLGLFEKIVLWNGANGYLMIYYHNYRHITT